MILNSTLVNINFTKNVMKNLKKYISYSMNEKMALNFT